jgi:hypothetical protein
MAKAKKELKKAPVKAAKALPAKKLAAKPMAKSTKKAEPKVKLAIVESKKGDKKSKELEIKAVELSGQVNEDEEEEMESSSSGGGSQSGLALAAASAGAETAAGSLKNFRHHPDIENFYRFIFENDLRYEGLEIIDAMALQRVNQKSVKASKARPN